MLHGTRVLEDAGARYNASFRMKWLAPAGNEGQPVCEVVALHLENFLQGAIPQNAFNLAGSFLEVFPTSHTFRTFPSFLFNGPGENEWERASVWFSLVFLPVMG